MDLSEFADAVGSEGQVTIAGCSTRGGPVHGLRCVRAPSGIDWIQADEMTVSCGAGTRVDDLHAALAEVGQRTVLPPGGSVGGALSAGRSGIRRLGDGPLRDALLQTHYVAADGAVVKAGGPTVKNVSGFDVCRLLVGAHGTLGFLGDVILRTRPMPLASQWWTAERVDPRELFTGLHRPAAVLWNGLTVWALLEGHPADVEAQAIRHGLHAAGGPPPLPAHRSILRPAEQWSLPEVLPVGSFVAELGVGAVHHALHDVERLPRHAVDPGVAALGARMKAQFDPSGRLNPGVALT